MMQPGCSMVLNLRSLHNIKKSKEQSKAPPFKSDWPQVNLSLGQKKPKKNPSHL